MLAAFAQADARADLLESLKNEAIAAKLLRITSPELNMVELANNPTDEDRVRIAAIALLNGFVPGDDQYAIFGGGYDRDRKPKPGKLYVKEAGYRTLFAHLGIVPIIEVSHPEFADLGTKDSKGQAKKIWLVRGCAECLYRGQGYEVTFGENNPIGLPGYESDNVAGIAAKARRRMLQALWQRVSPILNADEVSDDDTGETAPQDAPARLPEPEAKPKSELEIQRIGIEQQFDRCRSKLQNDAKALEFFNDSVKSINDAATAEELTSVGEVMRERQQEMKVSEQIMKELRALWKVRQQEIAESAQ